MTTAKVFIQRLVISSLFAMTVAACGQGSAPQPERAGQAKQAPPDISGIWGAQLLPSLSDDPPLLPEAAKAFKNLDPESDPLAICKPPGLPRLMDLAFQFEIVQTPKVVYFLMEYGQHMRRIYIDGKHPENPDPTWFGHSIGHWKGRTLVVDTVGFNGHSWLDMVGHPQSDSLHLVERYTLSEDGKSLKQENVIDDPKTYSRPWETVTKTYPRAPGPILEYICETI